MAQRVITTLVDDVDGGEATETVTFALDGQGYEIDVNEGNADLLRSGLAHWIGSARRQVVAGGRKPARTDPAQIQAIRAWALEQGLPVSNRGRIPASVKDAFQAAHTA
jgi:hypothetical protein